MAILLYMFLIWMLLGLVFGVCVSAYVRYDKLDFFRRSVYIYVFVSFILVIPTIVFMLLGTP